MTKQEEIREGFICLIRMYNPEMPIEKTEWLGGLYLHYLHVKGVVIKVDDEKIRGDIGFIPVGYVAVVPLIEE